jgi:signal transduction histidine kinase
MKTRHTAWLASLCLLAVFLAQPAWAGQRLSHISASSNTNMAASGAGQSESANFTFPMWLTLTSSVAVALLLIILVWNVELKRQVKRHTSELTHRNEENAFLCEKLQQYANDLERRVIQRTEELTEANRDLHEAKEAAEDADRIKSAFLATMSHELRTPLNSIIGFTGILLQGLAGPLNTEQRKQLDMVRTSSRHLLSLINDVLDISKIEAGQLNVACERFDLRASIVKIADSVKPMADKKGLALRVDLAPGVGVLASDPRRVEQILLNLLNNAIKFTEQGAVTLTADTGPGMLCLTVADTGIGIKPEQLCTLFQPFRQIDTGLSRQHEGTGLGLAICRRLAGLLGGEIHAASVWGSGSTFTFTLPKQATGVT